MLRCHTLRYATLRYATLRYDVDHHLASARQAGPSSKKRSCSLHGNLDPRPKNDLAYARQVGTSSDRRCVYAWLRVDAYAHEKKKTLNETKASNKTKGC